MWNKITSKLFQPFSFRQRKSEIILFQRVETFLKLFRNYFTRALQLMNIFQHVQCRWNNFEIIRELCHRAGNGSLRMTQVTHWAFDPWPMWPMTHGSPGPSPHTRASLTQIYRLPGSVFGHCICVHTTLSCYLIARASKLHTQAPVNLEFWYIIIATIYKPSHRVKKLMGHGSTPSDPWPMTHRPIPCSVPRYCRGIVVTTMPLQQSVSWPTPSPVFQQSICMAVYILCFQSYFYNPSSSAWS